MSISRLFSTHVNDGNSSYYNSMTINDNLVMAYAFWIL